MAMTRHGRPRTVSAPGLGITPIICDYVSHIRSGHVWLKLGQICWRATALRIRSCTCVVKLGHIRSTQCVVKIGRIRIGVGP